MQSEPWELWRVLCNVYPMPLSRTRDRILSWLYNARQAGLITLAEHKLLANADAEQRGLNHG